MSVCVYVVYLLHKLVVKNILKIYLYILEICYLSSLIIYLKKLKKIYNMYLTYYVHVNFNWIHYQ